MSEQPLSASRMLAEALSPELFAARRNLDLAGDRDVVMFVHSLSYSPAAHLRAVWAAKHPVVAARVTDSVGLLRDRLENLALRLIADSATVTGTGPLAVSQADDTPDLETLKERLLLLERKQRASRLSGPERAEAERLRVAVRTEREQMAAAVREKSQFSIDQDRKRHERRLQLTKEQLNPQGRPFLHEEDPTVTEEG